MESLIGLAGLFIAWLTFCKIFATEDKERKKHLLSFCDATRKLSIEIKQGLTDYAIDNSAWDAPFLKNISFKKYISLLKESQESNLSGRQDKRSKG
jgi:hypothetical protein